MRHCQGARRWLLIGLMLVVVLVSHDLFMTGSARAGEMAQPAPPVQTHAVAAPGATAVHHAHFGERDAETPITCIAVQPGLNPERTAPARLADAGVVDLAAEFPAVRRAVDERTLVPISPQHRRALLQVFLI